MDADVLPHRQRIILPITGWLANHFGRKRLLLASIVGFTGASFLCGLAPTLPFLIVCRIVQGACGGGLQPLSQAILLDAFPPEERGQAMGFRGLGIVVAPMLGPVLGGWLTDTYTWRWVFYVNVPIGVLSVFLVQLFVFDPPYIRRARGGVDYWGIGMLAVGVGALQIVLDKGQEADWFGSRWITALALISPVILTVFVVRELWVRHPVVDLRVFALRTYSTGALLMTVLGFGLYGAAVILPLLLQTLLGYPALDAGIAMLPRGLGSFVAMPLVGFMMSRVDARKLLGLGVALAAYTMVWLGSLSLNLGYWDIFWPQLIQGLALGLVFVPLTTVTMDPIPNERMGNATSVFNLMRNLGGSVGIALAETLITRREQAYTSVLGAHVTASSPETGTLLATLRDAFLAAGADVVTATHRAYAELFSLVEQQAAMRSYNDAFWVLGLMFLATLPLILLMQRPAGQRRIRAE